MLIVNSGGTADLTTIDDGGLEIVSAGGTDVGAKIAGASVGGEQDVFGLASGATIFTGSQVVEAGGTASGTVVSVPVFETFDALIVSSGGFADQATIYSSETISAGGTDFGAQISGGTH